MLEAGRVDLDQQAVWRKTEAPRRSRKGR
jgi:hypothetical protein